MKSLFTLLWAVVAICMANAQTKYAVIRPAELVTASKNAHHTFEKETPFKLSSTRHSEEASLPEAQSLELDEETLSQINAKAPAQFTLVVPRKGAAAMEVELVRVNIFSSDFSVVESKGDKRVKVSKGMHYRGVVKGDPGSVAALSVFETEIVGLFSSQALGNLTLAPLPDAEKDGKVPYLIYDDMELQSRTGFYCGTADDGIGYDPDELHESLEFRGPGDCVRVYFEVDNDIYTNKGGSTGATNYVTALFNQVAALYANDNISAVISQIYLWSTASPFNGATSADMLTQFQNTRTTFNGDIGQLLSYKTSGGIAVLNGLCHPYTYARLSFSSINPTFANIPTYSFSVLVVAHELGHLLGSHHTHACVWNGNNTAIDGCAGFTEGGCANPGNPSGGGTIMSYCHITSVGINLNLGFGSQPGAVIRNRIANATCMQACSTSGGGTGGGTGSGGGTGGGTGSGGGSGSGSNSCANHKVYLALSLDNFGPETTWKLKPADDTTVLYSGGPYAKGIAGTIMRDTFCLPQGCYEFVIMDAYGDGICCAYGQGSYALTDAQGQVLAAGGNFGFDEMKSLCVPYNNGSSNCVTVNFNNYTISSYGTDQDLGTYQLLNAGSILKIQNNAWKSIALNYNITPSTILEFEFGSTVEGEVHGIGFDNNNTISYNYTFKVHGTQDWGILDYDNYPGGSSWKKYTIPVGQYYTGAFDRLYFAADNDSGTFTGNSYFRNIKIYQGSNGCNNIEDPGTDTSTSLPEEASAGQLHIFPNPAQDVLQVEFADWGPSVQLSIFNAFGQLVHQTPRTADNYEEAFPARAIDIQHLPQGTYFLKADNGREMRTAKFTIARR